MGDWAIFWFCGFCLAVAALCWVTFMYAHEVRRCRETERDNYRLLRRLGQVYGMPLGVYEPLPNQPPTGNKPTYAEMSEHPDTQVPPAFRTKKPIPPMGYRPDPRDGVSVTDPTIRKDRRT